jgi:hypothetical protein
MDEKFLSTLSGVNKVLYKSEYEFHMKYHKGATHESAHQEGLKKIKMIEKFAEQESKPKMYVDLSTGRKFMATENDLASMHS